MDSLLGIGEAGGKTGSKFDEGRELADRLKEMRKARDVRAKDAKRAANGSGNDNGSLTSSWDDLVSAQAAKKKNANSKSNKKKKGKK